MFREKSSNLEAVLAGSKTCQDGSVMGFLDMSIV